MEPAMKKPWFLAAILVMPAFLQAVTAQDTGEKLFNSTCIACHTINRGNLIGPPH
jgi:mono/diheme cytochrome c family protein